MRYIETYPTYRHMRSYGFDEVRKEMVRSVENLMTHL